MKTKTKLIAAVISSIVLTGPVIAQEDNNGQLSFLNKPADNFVPAQEAQPLQINTGQVQQAQPVENMQAQHVQATSKQQGNDRFRKVEAFIDPVLSAERAKQISEIQHSLEMSKLRMREAEINEQIAELNAKQQKRGLDAAVQEKQEAWDTEKTDLVTNFEDEIKSLKDSNKFLRKQLTEKDEIDGLLKGKIFVTQVSGIGHNLKARVYYDNNISTRRVGDEVIAGAIVSRIEPSGMYVMYKGEKQFIPITTTAHAHFKSFEKNERESEGLPPELNGLAQEVNSPGQSY